MPAELRGNDRAARFAIRGSHANATEEGMHGNLHGKIGVDGFEGCGVGSVIDVIEPQPFGQRLGLEHRRVVRGADRSEAGREGTDASVSVDLEIEDLDGERVSGLRALNVERTRQRIVALGHAHGVAGLFDAIAETVERVGVEDVSGFQVEDGLGSSEQIFHVVVGGGVVRDILGEDCGRQEKNCGGKG